MQEFKILSSIRIGKNTAITIDSNGIDFRNGMVIFDEHNISYTVLSVGISRVNPEHVQDYLNIIDLLIEGEYTSAKIHI